MAIGAKAKVTMVVDTKKPTKNIGELTKKIQDMKSELEGTDIGSARFDELSTAIRGASGELKELERNMEGLDAQQKAESFVKMGEGIAGGFAIGSGAMALFGTESEAMQELQTRVQGAIAIAMGVRMMSEAAMQAATAKRVIQEKLALMWSGKGRLATLANSAANWVMTGSTTALTVAKGGATLASILLRGAMMAIPIVAIVMGIMSLVSALASWFGSSEETTEAVVDNSEAAREAADAVNEYRDSLRTAAEWQRKSDNATTESEKKLVSLNKQLSNQISSTDEMTRIQAAYIETLVDVGYSAAYADSELKKLGYTDAYNKGLIGAEEAIRDLIEAQEDLIKQEAKAEEKRKKSNEKWKQRQKDKESQLKSLRKLEEELVLMEEQDDDERNKKKNEFARQAALRAAEEIRDEDIKRRTILQINDNYDQLELNRLKKIQDKKDELAQVDIDKAKEMAADRQKELDEMLADQLASIKAIKDGERRTEINAVKAHFDELVENENLTASQKVALTEEANRQIAEINDEWDEIERQKRAEKLDEYINGALDAIGAVLDAFTQSMQAQMDEIDQKARKDLEVEGLTEKQKENIQKKADKKKAKIAKKQQKIAAAMAIIETYKSATMAFSSLAGIPVVGPVLGGIAAAAAIVAGIANVKQIYAQDVGGGGGGGGSGGAPAPKPQPAAPATTGAFSLGGSDASKKPVKAYVVTDEMTDSQEQLEGIRQQSIL